MSISLNDSYFYLQLKISFSVGRENVVDIPFRFLVFICVVRIKISFVTKRSLPNCITSLLFCSTIRTVRVYVSISFCMSVNGMIGCPGAKNIKISIRRPL